MISDDDESVPAKLSTSEVARMSSQYITSQITSLQHEIERLNRQLVELSKKEAANSQRAVQIQKQSSRTTSPSILQSKLRDLERLQSDNAQIQTRKADITKRIAEKTAKMHELQQRLNGEQAREQQRMQDSLWRLQSEDRIRETQYLTRIQELAESPDGPANDALLHEVYDAFISHASEDKDEVVRPLAEALSELGYRIWYDEFALTVGDSLRRKVDQGLAQSRFGVVVLSASFFAKNWPQYELDGLVAKEMVGSKVILPVWHKVSKDEVMRYSPSLADRFALSTASYTIEELAEKLGEVLVASRGTESQQKGSGL